jgi:hypothetical protein
MFFCFLQDEETKYLSITREMQWRREKKQMFVGPLLPSSLCTALFPYIELCHV